MKLPARLPTRSHLLLPRTSRPGKPSALVLSAASCSRRRGDPSPSCRVDAEPRTRAFPFRVLRPLGPPTPRSSQRQLLSVAKHILPSPKSVASAPAGVLWGILGLPPLTHGKSRSSSRKSSRRQWWTCRQGRVYSSPAPPAQLGPGAEQRMTSAGLEGTRRTGTKRGPVLAREEAP